jgi:hypothetical protein
MGESLCQLTDTVYLGSEHSNLHKSIKPFFQWKLFNSCENISYYYCFSADDMGGSPINDFGRRNRNNKRNRRDDDDFDRKRRRDDQRSADRIDRSR